jgi:macrodomain Ter protein organizer (MatP/YcbG family)
MITNDWYVTTKGWKRKKSSIYLKEHIHKKLLEIADRNQLSFSETVGTLIEQRLATL